MNAIRIGLWHCFTGLCTVGLLAMFAPAAISAPTSTWSDWFNMRPEAAKLWQVVPDPGDGMRFRITNRQDGAPGGQAKQVMVLFPKKSSAYDTAMYKLLSIFGEKKLPVVFTVINFNKAPEKGREALEFAKRQKFDLIYSMGSNSTAFVHKNFRGEPISVVSVCSKDPVLLGQMADYSTPSGSNMAYTSLNVPLQVQMTYLLELKPNLKTIAVMYARKNKSAVVTQVEPLRALAESKGIRVIDVAVEDQQNARSELNIILPKTVKTIRDTDPKGQNSVFWITGSTSVFREIETINSLAWKIPVLSVVPDVVKEGDDSAVLSIGVGFESNAHLAAVYGVKILSGESTPGELTVGVVSPPDIAINFRVARRIGLKIPFSFFESATFVYDYDGSIVRKNGLRIAGQ